MPDKEEMDFQFPTMSKGMKKLITGYLVIFVLLIATVAGLQLMQQNGIGDTRRQASTDGIDFTLTPSKTSVAPNEEFTVDVNVTTHTKQMTAIDLQIQIDTNRFDFVKLVPLGALNAPITTSPQAPYVPNRYPEVILFPVQTGDPYYIDRTNLTGTFTPGTNGTGIARLALGVPCDRCYLGAAPPMPTPGVSPIPQCQTSPAPQCYPFTNASGSTRIATLTLRAKTAGTGNVTIAQTTDSAELDSDADATVDYDSEPITVTGSTPTATPTVSGALCNIDLVAPFGTINLADYGNFKTKYIAYLQNSTYDASIDFAAPTGTINLADYGVFKTKYITYLQSTTCN